MTGQKDEALPIYQGFALRDLSHTMFPSPKRGSSFLSSSEQVKLRNEFVQQHAASVAEYNVAMSLTDVDYSDLTTKALVRESVRIHIGTNEHSGLYQNHIMLLHMTNDDAPVIVEAWSDPVDLEGDISEDEALFRKRKSEVNMYMKLLDFWDMHPGARVLGRILPGMRLNITPEV